MKHWIAKLTSTLCAATLIACGGAQHGATTAAHSASPPKLVVVVVLDQFGSWVLERYMPLLPEDGFLKTLIARGTYVRNVRYAYAGTLTAPGHAAIFTGATPSEHNIPANRIWSHATQHELSVVDDGEHAIFEKPTNFAGPGMLRAQTVGDVLKQQQAGAHVISLSMKDRSAVLPGGHVPDISVWYNAGAGGFTTSSFYTPTMPDWLATFRANHPIDSYFEEWLPLDAEMLANQFGPDRATGEGDWDGFGTEFPHNPARSRKPAENLLITPAATRYELDLARTMLDQYAMGQDEVTDLFAISISGTDLIGHTFGPESWEYADNLLRVDRMLGDFLRHVESRTTVSWLVTADHGVARLAERATDNHEFAQRLYPRTMTEMGQSVAHDMLGDGLWVDGCEEPFVYFSPQLRAHPRHVEVKRAIMERLRTDSCVLATYDVEQGEALRASSDPIEHAVGLSIDPDRRGDVYIVTREGCRLDEGSPEGFGTTHGSPWDYDARVPVIFAGPGVQHRSVTAELPQARVAATIAQLLGIHWIRNDASLSDAQ